MDHRTIYRHPYFGQLPFSTRILFSLILITFGIGYVFALVYVIAVHGGRDGKAGLSVHDLEIAYAGSRVSRLESALRGPMAPMLSKRDATRIIDWIHDGMAEDAYKSDIAPIVAARCAGCHNGTRSNIPRIVEFSDVSTLASSDEGVSIITLIRVSHIHLFGMTFIFAITGFIFSHAYVKSRYLKSVVLALPFLAIFLDIASWWLTKVSLVFAYVVMGGGIMMAMSFAVQWYLSLYQMWIVRVPAHHTAPD